MTWLHEENAEQSNPGMVKESLEESNTKFAIWSDLMGENLDSSLQKAPVRRRFPPATH
jgi:hypothetical protein